MMSFPGRRHGAKQLAFIARDRASMEEERELETRPAPFCAENTTSFPCLEFEAKEKKAPEPRK